MHGTVGVLLALLARERTGRGQFVDVAHLDAVISLLAGTAPEYFATGQVSKLGETRATGSAPFTQVFRCQDGEYITIGSFESHLWDNLYRALGREDLIPFHNPACERWHG